MSTVDLSDLPPRHQFHFTLEREETTGESAVRLFKDVTLFVLAIAFVGVIAWLCIRTLLQPASSPEEKKWAMSILSATAGGLIGYLIRK